MKQTKRLLVAAGALALVAGACGSDSESAAPEATTAAAGATTAAAAATTAGAATTAAAAAGAASIANGTIECKQQYKGKEVRIFSPVRNSETEKVADQLRDAYKPFEACTGVKVIFDGTDQFETEVQVRVNGGNPPDLIDFPQPGAFLGLVAKSQLKPFPDKLANAVKNDNVAGWPELATVNGKVYGVPVRGEREVVRVVQPG